MNRLQYGRRAFRVVSRFTRPMRRLSATRVVKQPYSRYIPIPIRTLRLEGKERFVETYKF